MSERDSRASLLEPGPACLKIAPLLPILDEAALDAGAAAEARAHLATCAYCQAQHAIYEQLDRVLVRHFAPNVDLIAPITVEASSTAWHDEQPHIELDDLPILAPQSRSSGRRRGYALGLASLAAVLVLSLLAGALFATHPHSQPGKPLSTPVVIPGSQNQLEHISMVSAGEGWAVGESFSAGGGENNNLVMHYIGGKWFTVATDLPSGITGIKMISATDGWIVGLWGLAHYDGHSWQRVDSPALSGLNALAVVSPTDIWAVGDSSYGSPREPTIVHYDGVRWSLVAAPESSDDSFYLTDIAMVSAGEGWAIGLSNTNRTTAITPTKGIVLHYTSGAWHMAQVLPNTELRGLGMVSSTDGWIVGISETVGNGEIIDGGNVWWRYHDGTWVQAALPANIDSFPKPVSRLITASQFGQLWAVGGAWQYEGDPGEMPYAIVSVVLRYRNGTWTKQPDMPTIKDRREVWVYGISVVAPDEFWEVGWAVWWTGLPVGSSSATQPTITPLILHYKQGVWTVVAS